jgi:hypothetical protein
VADRKTKVTLTHEQFVSEGARDGHRNGGGGILEKLGQTMSRMGERRATTNSCKDSDIQNPTTRILATTPRVLREIC